VALLAIVIAVTMGPGAAWLAAGVTYKVGRLALVVAAGAFVYFGALFALGFRVADFNRREATLPDALPPGDDTGG
jgi:putative peptidoglycan lipid II flippase